MTTLKAFTMPLLAASLVFVMSGCATNREHRRSSVVEYLFPDQNAPAPEKQKTVLSLPLDVGVAFVPPSKPPRTGDLTETQRMALLNEVRSHFKEHEFVRKIHLIPSAYLIPKGSFANLDQVSTMFGVDVIALISYDQTQFTSEGIASIAYWTIIGAYIVSGEKNDTHTMVDAVLYDVKSRTLLFRAPGQSHIKSRATIVNLSKKLRQDTLTGFNEASKDLVKNLDIQLKLFREKVKESPQEILIAHKPGYTGGGAIDPITAICALAFAGATLRPSKKKNI